MQNTLNFPTTTTTTTITSTSRQPLTPPLKLNFPPNNPTFPSFSYSKPSKFPSFSLKITTIHPFKPSNTPPSPTTTPPPSKTPPLPTTTKTHLQKHPITTTKTTFHSPKPSKTLPFHTTTPPPPSKTQPLPTTTKTHLQKHLITTTPTPPPSKTRPFPTTTKTHIPKHLITTTTTTTTPPPSKTQPLPTTTKTHIPKHLITTTTTTIHPPKPSKTQPLPTTTKTHYQKHPITTTHNPQFQEKALFLDSIINLDSLNLLPPTAIAAASSLSDLKSLIDYLSSLGFSPPQLRRIFTICPQILSLHISQIAPIFAFLLREVAVQSTHLPRAISSRPRLLLSDVETRLRPTLYFLQSLGIHQVNHHTNLLSSSVEEKYIPKIQFFENVGFSYHDAISMFRRFPPLFCYSIKGNYEPKFNYFVVEMGRDLKELKGFPQYFSFSLDKRIKPRHQVCVDSGVCFSLPILLKSKDDEFRKRLDVCCNSSMPKTSSPLWVSN